jgi:two-component system, response regulator RegA
MRSIDSILLVDDDHAFRTTLQSALRRRGLTTRTAATVEEGLVLLEDEPVDLIVLDYRLPQSDGVRGVERYRRACPDAVIAILTGYGDIPLAVEAVRKGADLFLQKPMEVERLLREAEQAKSDRPRGSHPPNSQPVTFNLEELERDAISAAMRESSGVVAKAAKLLGIDRRTLQRKLRRME